MQMKKTLIGLALLALTVISTLPAAQLTAAQTTQPALKQWRTKGWKAIETDVVTIIFPAGGKHPIFIWYYNRDNKTIHVVHFKGIWDYFTIDVPHLIEFRRNLNFTAELVNKTITSKLIRRAIEIERLHRWLQLHLNKTAEKARQLSLELEEATNATRAIKERFERAWQIRMKITNETRNIVKECYEAIKSINNFNESLRGLKEECGQGGCDISLKVSTMKAFTKQLAIKIAERLLLMLNQTMELNATMLRSRMHEMDVEIGEMISLLNSVTSELNATDSIIQSFFGPGHHLLQRIRQRISKCRSHLAEISEKLSLIRNVTRSAMEEADELEDEIREARKHFEHASKVVKVIREVMHELKADLEEGAANYTDLQNIVNVALNASINISHVLQVLNKLNVTTDVEVAASLARQLDLNVSKVKSFIINIEKNISKAMGRCHEEAEKARQMMENIKGMVAAWKAKWRPPFFHFASGFWNLTDVGPITAEDGTEIGVTFTYKLTYVPNPHFKFLEDNLMIRCRFYYVPVKEEVGNVTYTVTKAELKMDFVLSKWNWILDEIKEALEEYGVKVNGTEGLALWIDAASLNLERLRKHNMTIVEAGEKIATAAARASILTHVNAVGREVKVNVNVKVNATKEYERPLPIPRELGEHLKIRFLSENETLGGFFKFINVATVTYPNGTRETVDVKASYLEAGGALRIFICYPYFDGGILEHDPSIGLEVEETTTPEALNPIYTLQAPTAGELEPTSALIIMAATPKATEITATHGETIEVEVALKDAYGRPVESASVEVTIAGTTYTATEVEPGVYAASIPTEDLSPGKYVAEVEASKEGYSLAEASINIVINPKPPAQLIVGFETVVMTAVAIGAIATAIIVTKKRAGKKV